MHCFNLSTFTSSHNPHKSTAAAAANANDANPDAAVRFTSLLFVPTTYMMEVPTVFFETVF